MKKLFAVILLAVALAGVVVKNPGLRSFFTEPAAPPESTSAHTATQVRDARIVQAFNHRESDLQVQGAGTVLRVLSDDTKGSRHQRFILRLAFGHTLLVAHNIDLAPRIAGLKVGDQVEFYGEYEWNPKGGVVHWTHHDPKGKHLDGWLRHQGNVYQ